MFAFNLIFIIVTIDRILRLFHLISEVKKLKPQKPVLIMSASSLTIFLGVIFTSIVYGSISYDCMDDACDFCLGQSDFDAGTYIITQSGKYCLAEDITLDPYSSTIDVSQPNANLPYARRRVELDYVGTYNFADENPSCTNTSIYEGCNDLINGKFGLGFFTAILIQIDNVEIDLKNYKISQCESFYYQQRPFSIIKIGSGGYNALRTQKGQTATDYISNIFIHDGVIGLSSYSGIQLNNVNDIKLEKLRICDFDVAAVIGNDFTNANFDKLIIGPSASETKRMLYLLYLYTLCPLKCLFALILV